MLRVDDLTAAQKRQMVAEFEQTKTLSEANKVAVKYDTTYSQLQKLSLATKM